MGDVKLNAEKENITLRTASIEDFGNVVSCSVRYGLGRRTYITAVIAEFIIDNLEAFSDRTLTVMAKDIHEALDSHRAGDECDVEAWDSCLESIYSEFAKRSNAEYLAELQENETERNEVVK